MRKVFSNRRMRRLSASVLLGVQIGILGFEFASADTATAVPEPAPPVAIEDSSSTTESGDVESAVVEPPVVDANLSEETDEVDANAESNTSTAAELAADSSSSNSSDSSDELNNLAELASGGSELTWGDIYSTLNDVDSSLKTLDEYMKDKTVTEKDYYATVIGMYLSQYTACMQGNLINVVTGLEENLSTEDLSSYLMIGNKKDAIKVKTALDYIKSNYSVTPIYKGGTDSKLDGVASVRDLYEKEATSLFIKDTRLDIKSFEVTNTVDGEGANTKVEGGTAQWIPALSYSARNSDSFTINNIDLEEKDEIYCVFNASSACRLSLQFCYSELERALKCKEGEYMWQKQEEILDQGLYLDSFGNIVALDPSNKKYVIVINCMLNPTICAIGANETFNMSSYNVQSVYTDYNATGLKEMGWNSSGGSDPTYEYVVACSKKAYQQLDDEGTKYIATKWVSNMLGSVTRDVTPDDTNYFSVFSFANDKVAEKNEVKSVGSEKITKPDDIGSVDYTLGSINFPYTSKTKGGEIGPTGGLWVSLVDGAESGQKKYNSAYSSVGGVSVAYIRTNHNRATEAYYGYKNLLSKGVENVSKGWGKVTGLIGGNSKVMSSNRGNMGGYTTMPVPSSCLFFGIGDKKIQEDSNVLNFDYDPLNNGEEDYKHDVIGYHKDYTSFYDDVYSIGSGTKMQRYIGFLYTPKTISRGTDSGMSSVRGALPTVPNLDADTILMHLRFCCKSGILRKSNITNLGRKSSSTKEAKGFAGYHEASKKLIKNANKKVKDYIESGFDLANDSPVNGIKWKNIWAMGLDIYGTYDALLAQSARTVVVYDTCTGKSHKLDQYDTVEFFMAVAKNTSSAKTKVTEGGELSQEAKDALKEEKSTGILDRVYDMLCNPVKTFVKMVSGFLQWLHTGLSNGNLASFFYITDDDVSNWLGKMPYILFMVTIAILAIRIGLASMKFIFNKEYNFKELTKDFIGSACLVSIPIICLSTMRSGIGVISDKGMNDSVIKIESVYLNKQLNASMQIKNDAKETGNTSTMYFIEHFQAKRTAEVGIDVLCTSKEVKKKKINPNEGKTSKFEYEVFNIQNLPSVFNNIAEENAQTSDSGDESAKYYAKTYDGQKFCTVFHDYYKQSVFFYFLDYYFNEWCLLNGKNSYYYETNPDWAMTMQNEMCVSKDSFRNLYSKRAVVYGPSAGLTSSEKCLDDIFGLGQLFYKDGSKPETRGYYLPIEIFDDKMKDVSCATNLKLEDAKSSDTTFENSSTDLWNGYKHGSYFIDNAYSVKNKDADEESEENLEAQGDSKRTMAYGPYALAKRADKFNAKSESVKMKPQVIASEAIFEANDIDKKYATDLELALWEINNEIYSDTMDYFNQSTGEVNDYTDAVMLAAISTFKFNEKFGKSYNLNDSFDLSSSNYVFKVTENIKPISFSKELLDMDVIMKAIYAGDDEVKEEYDLMYYLGNDGFGIVAAIILIVAEVFIIAYIIVRMIHLVIMYVLTTTVCTFQYSLKQNKGNKAWLGVLAQAVYFLAAHGVLIFMVNTAVCNDFNRGGMTNVLMSLLLLFGAIFAMSIEIRVMLFLVMNLYDLGGSIIADKVNSAMAQISGAIKGRLNGDTRSNKVNMHADEVKSYGNDDDAEIKQNSGGNSELVESVEQADRVRGAMPGSDIMLPVLADVGVLGDLGGGEIPSGETGGSTFGETNFQNSGGNVNTLNMFDIDSMSLSNSESTSTFFDDDSMSFAAFSASNSNTVNSGDYRSYGDTVDNGNYGDYGDYGDYSSVDNSYLDDSYVSTDNSFIDNSVIDSGNDNSTTINE